jgi:hypothetical protein
MTSCDENKALVWAGPRSELFVGQLQCASPVTDEALAGTNEYGAQTMA